MFTLVTDAQQYFNWEGDRLGHHGSLFGLASVTTRHGVSYVLVVLGQLCVSGAWSCVLLSRVGLLLKRSDHFICIVS